MLILCLLLFQELDIAPEPVNAKVFMENGDVLELKNIQFKGIEPYAFDFKEGREKYLLSIFRVSQILRLDRRGAFQVILDSGEAVTGTISATNMSGIPTTHKEVNRVVTGKVSENYLEERKRIMITLSNVRRIHFISGFQLRACVSGHYEQYTPYPFCPVCSKELQIGPYREDPPETSTTLPPFYRLRLDPRNPSSRRN